MSLTPLDDAIQQTIAAFWESVPRIWHTVRSHILKVATEEFSITVEQFHILRRIRRGRNSVSQLAEAKQISRPAISRSVDALVNRGFITRTQNPQDRRHVQLDLTEEGEALVDAIFGNVSQWMGEQLSTLDEDELEGITHAVRNLKRAFD